ncbi:hypothetical protein HanIR_Chr17g0859771 [Helianthus annuus]|nr:hypothetical protein HanIR_Chr17g0859771 [Helianthus annuus]
MEPCRYTDDVFLCYLCIYFACSYEDHCLSLYSMKKDHKIYPWIQLSLASMEVQMA